MWNTRALSAARPESEECVARGDGGGEDKYLSIKRSKQHVQQKT
jgi:hypothetical protein